MNALRSELTWTHYRLLLKVEKEEARNFYMLETVKDNWSTRVLERQINSLLYERLALSKDREKVLELSTKGQVVQEPADIIKDPYVLEFLDLKESRNFLEKDLKHALIDKLQAFLLELGKGFSFVARQRRITVDKREKEIAEKYINFLREVARAYIKKGKRVFFRENRVVHYGEGGFGWMVIESEDDPYEISGDHVLEIRFEAKIREREEKNYTKIQEENWGDIKYKI